MKIFFLILVLIPTLSFSAIKGKKKEKLKYRTNFGSCPSRTAGTLAIKLIKVFEENKSLHDVKKEIVSKNLAKKHFLSDYKIKYNPLKNHLSLTFNCPKPLMKAQIYRENGEESYDAILVDNGTLVDPTYEVLLRSEKKLTKALPYLALPVGDLEQGVREDLTDIINGFGKKFRDNISEVIIGEDDTLTIILSVKGQPSSVFFGQGEWEAKSKKLRKIINYMASKKKIPAIINLTNAKKVVVKFSDRI